jgi:CBS domain-containing protein
VRLADVATLEVETIPVDAQPWQAAERMHAAAVGSLVVIDGDGRAVGILTDRDLALRVAAVGGLREDARVADVMSAPLQTLGPDDDVELAVKLMRGQGLRRIPLLDRGRVVGLVSMDDLVRSLARELLNLGEEALSARKHSLRDARGKGPLHEIQELASQAHERLGRAKYMAQEAFMDEVDGVKERLRRALERL